MNKFVFIFIGLITFITTSFAQINNDDILFTVNEEAVKATEFIRVYSKNLDLVKDESQKDVDELVNKEPSRLAIRDGGKTTWVNQEDIEWIDAAGDYMCIHVGSETHIMRSTLKSLMSRFDPEKFKRIHRSTIVNLDRIVKATPLQKGEYMLDLDCGEKLKVSRNYRQEVKLFLDAN